MKARRLGSRFLCLCAGAIFALASAIGLMTTQMAGAQERASGPEPAFTCSLFLQPGPGRLCRVRRPRQSQRGMEKDGRLSALE